MNKGNWKAWVDNMPSPSSKRPTLHVYGQITVGDKAKRDLVKSASPPFNEKICLLEIQPHDSEGDITCELKYEEVLNDSDTYTQVQIMAADGNDVTIPVEQASLSGQQQTEREASV